MGCRSTIAIFFGLTAIGYGREKANSQLAVLEETGFVGGILYVILIASIGRELFYAYRRTSAGY